MTKELCTREAYDDSPSTAGQNKNLRAVVEAPQKPKSTTVDIPPAAEPLAHPPEAPEVPEDEKKEPTAEPEDDEEMQGGAVGHKSDTQECRAQAEARSAQKHKRKCL